MRRATSGTMHSRQNLHNQIVWRDFSAEGKRFVLKECMDQMLSQPLTPGVAWMPKLKYHGSAFEVFCLPFMFSLLVRFVSYTLFLAYFASGVSIFCFALLVVKRERHVLVLSL